MYLFDLSMLHINLEALPQKYSKRKVFLIKILQISLENNTRLFSKLRCGQNA